jgi:putative exporter of polyketide antibiotics
MNNMMRQITEEDLQMFFKNLTDENFDDDEMLMDMEENLHKPDPSNRVIFSALVTLLSLLGILLSIFCVIILIHIVEKSLFS